MTIPLISIGGVATKPGKADNPIKNVYCGDTDDTAKPILRGAPILIKTSYRIDIAGTWIDKAKPYALAWKMLGAGGGGNLLLVVDSIPDFAIPVRIRRRD